MGMSFRSAAFILLAVAMAGAAHGAKKPAPKSRLAPRLNRSVLEDRTEFLPLFPQRRQCRELEPEFGKRFPILSVQVLHVRHPPPTAPFEFRLRFRREPALQLASRGRQSVLEVLQEILHDQPYEDGKRIRVTGPFTVESLSPHRVHATDEPLDERPAGAAIPFEQMILDNLRKAGVQNTVKNERLVSRP